LSEKEEKIPEKNLILKVLRETEGNKYQAAKKLGITRSTLYGKLRKHGIMVPSNDCSSQHKNDTYKSKIRLQGNLLN